MCNHIDLKISQLLPKPKFKCKRCGDDVKNPSREVHHGGDGRWDLERTINGFSISNFEHQLDMLQYGESEVIKK